jgi:hypothetical protein
VEVGGNVKIDDQAWAYIDGTCEIALPPGAVRVQVAKGPEYRPIDTKLTLTAGKLSVRLAIERWADLRAEGWYSGDTACYFLSPHAALLEGAGEDLAVVNLLAWEVALRDRSDGYRTIANILEFSGQRPALEMPGHLVAVNTRNQHPMHGTLLLLNCHRVVYPLTFGGPGGFDNWTLMDWCDQCHRKGGLVLGGPYFRNITGYDYGAPAGSMAGNPAPSITPGWSRIPNTRPASTNGTAFSMPGSGSRSSWAAARCATSTSSVARGPTPNSARTSRSPTRAGSRRSARAVPS